MPIEVAAAGGRTNEVTIRVALPAEFAAIGELTVRAYATVGDPLMGRPAYAAYEEELRDGRDGVAILTRPSMTAAHRLYESLGFARVRSRDWEFEPGEWLWSYVLTF
jgi:hypothetical protein